MGSTIEVRNVRWAQGPEEREFQGILRRYELREQAEGRIRSLGALYLAISAVGVVSAGLAFLAIAPWGFLSGDPTATALLAGLGGAIATVLLVLSAPGLIGGLALFSRRSWARGYAMVLAALLLFWFPLGTILGTYTLYVLLQPEIRLYFERA